MKIIGIDPGYAIVGYGIVQYKSNHFTTIDYGALKTDPSMDFQHRIRFIYDSIDELIKTHKPDVMAVESLFFAVNKKTAIKVAQARGVIMLCASKNNIDFFEYTPLQVKQAVVGYGKAEKLQVMYMTKLLLNLRNQPKEDDVYDALAVAICHAHSSPYFLKSPIAKGNIE